MEGGSHEILYYQMVARQRMIPRHVMEVRKPPHLLQLKQDRSKSLRGETQEAEAAFAVITVLVVFEQMGF